MLPDDLLHYIMKNNIAVLAKWDFSKRYIIIGILKA